MSQRTRSALGAAAFKAVAVTLVLLVSPVAHATLVGVTVNGALGGLGSAVVGNQFATPALVNLGPTPEFSGTMSDSSAPHLAVSVDLFGESFVIDTHVSGQWGARIGDGFSVRLWDLAWLGASGRITDVRLTDTPGNTSPWDTGSGQLIGFTDDSILIQLQIGRPASGRASFEFGITTEHVVVPEPATAALLLLGLAGLRRGRATAA